MTGDRSITYRLKDFFLEFKTPFTIAHGTRTGTEIVLLEIEEQGIVAFGEASLPPYLPETPVSVKEFITSFFNTYSSPLVDINSDIKYLHRFRQGHTAAKASIEIALYNWYSKKAGKPLWEFLGLQADPLPYCTFTIGMGEEDEIRQKIKEAEEFHILKVKLGGPNDRQIIETIRHATNKPLCVDVNQGWKTKEESLKMLNWLADQNVLFVEQPMNKDDHEGQRWLFERSPLPIFADEAVQVPEEITGISNFYHGINIKLMKCGGISKALEMAAIARKLNLKVMIGSMSETGCAINAAAHLSTLADYTDLDGPMLTKNDPFDCVRYVNGKVILSQ